MGILYLVATPIGNMGDITLRAIKVLSVVDYIACEDTRKTGMLLKQLPFRHPELVSGSNPLPQFISYFEQNENQKIPPIISLLKQNKNVALVSNAGTPTISDPGFKLVRECINQNIQVISIPGPSSVISALVSSGLPTDKFLFLGFLPKKQGHRKNLFKNCKLLTVNCTLIFFESPYRLIDSLTDLKEIFGDIDIVICRELTKIHEEIRREKISDSLEYFSHTPPRGEFTIVFNILRA